MSNPMRLAAFVALGALIVTTLAPGALAITPIDEAICQHLGIDPIIIDQPSIDLAMLCILDGCVAWEDCSDCLTSVENLAHEADVLGGDFVDDKSGEINGAIDDLDAFAKEHGDGDPRENAQEIIDGLP